MLRTNIPAFLFKDESIDDMVAAKSPANNKPTVPMGIVFRANTK